MAGVIRILEKCISKDRVFQPGQEYCYRAIIKLDVQCPICSRNFKDKYVNHYIVDIDGVAYYVPEYSAMKVNKTLPDVKRNAYNQKVFFKQNFPSDFNTAYVELLGRKIVNNGSPDVNRKKELYTINFDVYYKVNKEKYPVVRRYPEGEDVCVEGEDVFIEGLDVIVDDECYIKVEDKVILKPKVTGDKSRYKFLWSTGETTESIVVSNIEKDMEYIVVVEDDLGCRKEGRFFIPYCLGSYHISYDASYHISCNEGE